MLTIIGCGNTNRSDDGAGVYVARRLESWLRDNPRTGVRVFDAGTGGMDVMFQARGSTKLVIIDACKTGSQAGAIFQVPGEELTAERESSFSLHDFRWDHALYAGRRIFRGDFPEDVTVFLVEAATLDLGLELTERVREGADDVIRRIEEMIIAYDSQ